MHGVDEELKEESKHEKNLDAEREKELLNFD